MVSTEQIDKVKNYIDITWNDKETDLKIEGIVKRATNILYKYAGTLFEIEDESDEEQLLLDLCRYIYNHAYEDFKVNFRSELIMLRAKYQCD